MVKKLQHHGKSHGEEATNDSEIDADMTDMHKKDADANDVKKNDLVETIATLENAKASRLKEEVAAQAASDTTEKGFCHKELADTNQKQAVNTVENDTP